MVDYDWTLADGIVGGSDSSLAAQLISWHQYLEGHETFVGMMNKTLLEGVRLNLVCWGVQLVSHSVRPHQLTRLSRLMERP